MIFPKRAVPDPDRSVTSRNDLISVYVPTRNRAKLLARALDSIWRQTHPNVEIIVVDDGSDDQTPDLLKAWESAGRLKWIRHALPLGACAARNTAINMATGRFITGLDDDDEMLPHRLSALMSALRPKDAFVCASDWLVSPRGRHHLRLCTSRIDAPTILSRNVVGNQIFAERKKVIACGAFDASLPAGQDYDLWIRMILQHGPARGLLRPLQLVHEHSETPRITNSPSRRAGYWLVYRKHKGAMSGNNRRGHLYNLRRAAGHRTLLPRDFRFFAQRNRLRLLFHALCQFLGSR